MVLRCFALLLLAASPSLAAEPTQTKAQTKGTPLRARVEQYRMAVEEDLFDDGRFAIFDAIVFSITGTNQSLYVVVRSTTLPPQSPLRIVGTRCRFVLDPVAKPGKKIYWGALNDLHIVPQPPDAPSAADLKTLEAQLLKLQQRAESERGAVRPQPSRIVAYYLLRGLTADRPQIVVDESTLQALDLKTVATARHNLRVFSVNKDVRVALFSVWLQDKSGTYGLRSAEYFRRVDGQWQKLGWGQIGID